jgi:hypothetical protein
MLIQRELRKDDGWITVDEKGDPIKNINDYVAVSFCDRCYSTLDINILALEYEEC